MLHLKGLDAENWHSSFVFQEVPVFSNWGGLEADVQQTLIQD